MGRGYVNRHPPWRESSNRCTCLTCYALHYLTTYDYTSTFMGLKLDIADAVEFGFEFQNGVRWNGEMDVVCDGSVIDVAKSLAKSVLQHRVLLVVLEVV